MPHVADRELIRRNEEIIADARRRYDEAEKEKRRLYKLMERMERQRAQRRRSIAQRLRDILWL